MIKSNSNCDGRYEAAVSMIKDTLDACEAYCKSSTLCVQFGYNSYMKECHLKKDGCEENMRTEDGVTSYRP